MPEHEQLWTIEQLAEYLQVHPTIALRMSREGLVAPAVRFNKRLYRWIPSQVRESIRAHQEQEVGQ